MRPLRNRDPEIYRLITIRTAEALLWITPNKSVRRLIGGIVARYQELFEISIYAVAFLGNHYHMLIKAPLGNADEFCENVNREVAKRLNLLHRREGKLWGRRYDDLEVLSQEDLLEAFLYINTNPTRHGLIEDSRTWPGLISYNQAITGEKKQYLFYHHSHSEEQGKVSIHTLSISPLPQYESLSQKKRKVLLNKLLTERTEMLVQERRDKRLGFLGAAKLSQQINGARPLQVSRSPKPPCYTFNLELRREFRKRYNYRRRLYDQASLRFRLGELTTEFPSFTFKPPLHRLPRLLPFKPIADLNHCA